VTSNFSGTRKGGGRFRQMGSHDAERKVKEKRAYKTAVKRIKKCTIKKICSSTAKIRGEEATRRCPPIRSNKLKKSPPKKGGKEIERMYGD